MKCACTVRLGLLHFCSQRGEPLLGGYCPFSWAPEWKIFGWTWVQPALKNQVQLDPQLEARGPIKSSWNEPTLSWRADTRVRITCFKPLSVGVNYIQSYQCCQIPVSFISLSKNPTLGFINLPYYIFLFHLINISYLSYVLPLIFLGFILFPFFIL